MAIDIGRLGYLGFALEATPGTPESSPSVYLPYSEGVTLREHHEPIEDISSRASRLMDADSVIGKTWGEGDVAINLDVVNSGYLFKAALGNELLATGTPNNHTFYTTVSGNTPKSATIWLGRGTTDHRQFAYSSVDTLDLEIEDGLGTLTASFMSAAPSTVASQTPTTTSGTVFAFKDYTLKFGSTLTAAAGASATPVNSFKLTIANNVETIFQSGSSTVASIRNKGCRVTGSYTLYFDSVTDRDRYMALNKTAIQATFTGITNESLRIRLPEVRLNEWEVETDLDDFYVQTCTFTAEDDVDLGVRLIDILLQNGKATVY